MPTIDPAGRPGSAFLLLDYEWFPRIEVGTLRTALSEFAETAFQFDREAGFSSIVEFRRDGSRPAGDPPDAGANRHLVAYARPPQRPGAEPSGEREIVAYLSITCVDGNDCGTAVLVVAPQFRSRGIATLLAERLAVESDDPLNWFGTGLKRLALESAGPHPAAQRLADRMNVAVAAERSLLVRTLRGPVERPESFGGPAVAVDVDEHDPDQPGAEGEHTYDLLSKHPQFARADTIVRRYYWLLDEPPAGAIVRYSGFPEGKVSQLAFIEFVGGLQGVGDRRIGALIDAATSDLWTAGVKGLLATIDARHDALARALQRRYFVHDQTDLTYVVDLERRPNEPV